MVFRTTYFRGQQKILGLAHEPVVLLGGQSQSAGFVAKEGKVQHYQRISYAPLLPSYHATCPFEGHERVLHIIQLTQTDCKVKGVHSKICSFKI